MDWKEALAGLNLPQAEDSVDEELQTDSEEKKKVSATRLNIVVEKKGRGGKTATIIEGFSCDDEELQEIAGKLKKRIGVGGSARCGEILLQGEWREKAADVLREMGFRVGKK